MGSSLSTHNNLQHTTIAQHFVNEDGAASPYSYVLIVNLPIEEGRWFGRCTKLLVRTPSDQDFLFHLQTIPPSGTKVLQKELGLSAAELQYVQKHRSIALTGATYLGIDEITQQAEDLLLEAREISSMNSKIFAETLAQRLVYGNRN